MKYIGDIINTVRRLTDNESYGTDYGIAHNVFVDVLNQAQQRMQSRILSNCPNYNRYDAQTTINLVSGTQLYSLPAGAIGGPCIRKIEYRRDAATKYRELPYAQYLELEDTEGAPKKWSLLGDQIIISPTPDESVGSLRVTYTKALDELALRVGQITSKTAITVVLDNDTWLDSTALTAAVDGYFCIVSAAGVVLDYTVSITGYDPATRTISKPNGTLVGNTGDFVVIGERASSHSGLSPEENRYLTTFAQWRILRLDSYADADTAKEEFLAIENDIIAAAIRKVRTVNRIPVINRFWS